MLYSYVLPLCMHSYNFVFFIYKIFQNNWDMLLNDRSPQNLTMRIYQDLAWKIKESLNSSRHMVCNEVVYCRININLRQRQQVPFLHLQIFLIHILHAESKHISLNLLHSCIPSYQNIKSSHCLESPTARQLIVLIIIYSCQFWNSITISKLGFRI